MVILKLEKCRRDTKVTEIIALFFEPNHPKRFYKYS